jgi:hypothetical protein
VVTPDGRKHLLPIREAEHVRHSIHRGVFGFGLLQDGDVRVGVFPEGEEVLIGSLCSGAVALHRVGSTELEMRQCANRLVHNDAGVVNDLLKLSGPRPCPDAVRDMPCP